MIDGDDSADPNAASIINGERKRENTPNMSANAFRIGYAGGGAGNGNELVAPCNLANGDLYTFPNATSTVDGTVPLTFTWNTRCPGISSTIDLYLYAPDTLGLIKQWGQIPFSQGTFQVQLMPRWWNSTTEARLQIAIMNSGGMSWATTGPPGPVFKVDYPAEAMLTTTTEGGQLKTITNSAAATNGGDAIFQNVASTQPSGTISKGAIAAAVVVPIIVIAAIVAVAVRFWRQREAEKRRRWSQALSSTSNLDWEKGARPGERTGSMFSQTPGAGGSGGAGGPGGRPSMSSYGGGAPRTSMAASSVWGENLAGAGAGAGGMRPPNMRNVSNDGTLNGAGAANGGGGGQRQSRISFAESARPERPDRRSRMSLGNDLRPHSAVFNLKPGSRSASDLPTSNLGPGASHAQGQGHGQGSPSPSKSIASSKLRGLQGSAIADDEDHHYQGQTPELRYVSSRRGSTNSDAARRSAYSAYSTAPTPKFDTSMQPDGDHDRTEDLEVDTDDKAAALPTATSTGTVAYGPDSLLAAYAARQAGATSPTPISEQAPMPMPMGMGMAMAPPPAPVPASNSKKGLKILTAFGKKGGDDRDKEKDKSSPASAHPQAQAQAQGHAGLQVPGVAMTRQGSGSVTIGRCASPVSPAPHAL